MSSRSRLVLLTGLKKSLEIRLRSRVDLEPDDRLAQRARWGLSPVRAPGDTPLPVVKKIRRGPSETRPPPDCQIPAPAVDDPVSVDHIVVCAPVAASNPMTYPT